MNKEKACAVQSLRTSKGQIEAVIRMIEEDRYCIDISTQLLAAQSLLKKANLAILRQHIDHCVREAVHAEQGDEKIDEIMSIVSRILDR